MIPISEHFVEPYRIVESDQSKLPKGVLCRIAYPICNIGERNLNNRIYEKAVWDKVMSNDALMEKMANRALFGQAEHPESTQSNLEKTSHVVLGISVDESSNRVFQEYDLLNTPYGRIINTLIEAECAVGVSTRAEGEIEEAVDESGDKYNRIIPEKFEYVTTDFTADPSTINPYPVAVQKAVVSQIQTGLQKEQLDKGFSTVLLEKLDCAEAVSLLESIQKEEVKPVEESAGDVPCRVAKGISVVSKSGHKMKILDVWVDSAHISPQPMIEYEYETVDGKKGKEKNSLTKFISMIKEDKEAKVNEDKLIVDNDGEFECQECGARLNVMPDSEDELECPNCGSSDIDLAEAKKIKASKPNKLVFEGFFDMVKYLEAKFIDVPDRVKDKIQILADSMQKANKGAKSVSVVNRQIKKLQISEASTRAEKDKAFELAKAGCTNIKVIEKSRNVEMAVMLSKLAVLEKAVPKKLTALELLLQKRVQENNVLKSEHGTAIDIGKKEKAKLIAEHKAELKLVEATSKRAILDKHIDMSISNGRLKIHKNSRALLESCASVEEVDKVLGEIIEGIRESALHSGSLTELSVKIPSSPEETKVKCAIQSVISGM